MSEPNDSASTSASVPQPPPDVPEIAQVDVPKATEDEAAAAKSASEPASTTKEPKPSTEPEKGNPLRWKRGLATFFGGTLVAFLLMANTSQLAFGVPLGTLAVFVATWGVLDFMGTFDDAAERVVAAMPFADLVSPLGFTVGGGLLFAASLAGGQSGFGPQELWGALVTLTFIGFVAAIFHLGVKLGPYATDEAGLERPLWRREGFWLLVIGALLYFPVLGNYDLWDPWETHYGEVAREILSRDDWISLWWAQDGWFWSKPILNFWIQAIAMATLGTHYKPDHMLDGYGGPTAHPEWVVRAPNVLFTLLALYIIYRGTARIFGRRAGFFGALVLATVPDWYFLAHQTMTDMPFVAPMVAAMGLLLLGFGVDPEAKARLYEVKVGKTTWRLSAFHLTLGAILVATLPQIIYLVTRNIDFMWGADGHGFRPHWDEFRSGSAGNCGLPGNEGCNPQQPASLPRNYDPHSESFGNLAIRFFGAFEPTGQALLWAGFLGFVLHSNWGERRLRRLFYLGAWFCTALATMAKGPAGFVLPILCTFAYLGARKRFDELLRLEVVNGLLVLLFVSMPWYVAMYVRHGSPFTDRLIFHDMFNRAFGHVHDTNEGDDTSFRFYVWQLGYALFPWTALAPLGLTWWLRKRKTATTERADAVVLFVMWFLFSFSLFSFMGTKFHHYIFPAVPAAAMLIGIAVSEMTEGQAIVSTLNDLWPYVVGVVVGAAVVTVGIGLFWPGSIFGSTENLRTTFRVAVRPASIVVLGVSIVAFAVSRWGAPSTDDVASRLAGDPSDARRQKHEALFTGAASIAGALLLVIVGRDLVVTRADGADFAGAIRLLHLFTYNYTRPWPDSLNFAAALAAITSVSVVLAVLLCAKGIRRHAAIGFFAVAFVSAVWALDVYMVKTGAHWGQHGIVETYYRARTGPDEPLVAYQMNWKGENFYTGNHVPAFVSSGQTFTSWLKKKKEEGTKVMFFVTEHHRVGGLKSETQAKTYTELTTPAFNNKFVLVKAEF